MVSVLGLGLPGSHPTVQAHPQAGMVVAMIDKMDGIMNSSKYDWEMFFVTPEDDMKLLSKKLKEKHWDIVMVGNGLRSIAEMTEFYEKIVNTIHFDSPKSKFSFNTRPDLTLEAVERTEKLQIN